MTETRHLVPGDEARVSAFLERYADSSIFLRSNLAAKGLRYGGERFEGEWVGAFDPDRPDEITGVAAHFWNDMLLVQAPLGGAELLARAVRRRSHRPIGGLIGVWDHISEARTALRLDKTPTRLDSREQLFAVELSELRLPAALESGEVRGRRSRRDDLGVVAQFRRNFEIEALGATPSDGHTEACREAIAAGHDDGTLFVLEDSDGRLLSTSNFNSTLPDTVQIGGVWTPPALRGKGYARACVGASLGIARSEGVSRSVLFTGEDNVAAQRAYMALGYEIVGDFGLVIFDLSR